MKLTLLLVALGAAVSAASASSAFFGDSTGGKIWSFCEPGKDDERFRPTKVQILPEQPTVGQDLTVTVDGILGEDVTGGSIDVDLRLLFLPIKHSFGLCDALGDAHDESGKPVSCPFKKGTFSLTVTKNIPKGTPALPVKGDVHVYDQDGKELTCIHLDLTLKK